MRVHELAKLAGATSADVLRKLREQGVDVSSASSSVDAEIAKRVLGEFASARPAPDVTPEEDLPDPRLLVRAAFEAARARKPDGWNGMTTAVLKNRLLQATKGSFEEGRYGARSMRDFAASLPDLLTVDDTTRPPTVRIREEGESAPEDRVHPGVNIRPDLWRAIVDYSVGHAWGWTGERAVPAHETDSQGRPLPTLSPQELASWRQEFVEQQALQVAPHDAARLDQWTSSSGATAQLPPALRPAWNERLKRQVLARLERWFADAGMPAPQDLLVPASREPSIGRRAPASGSLRDLVVGCVGRMSEAELESLSLPAGAVHRYLTERYGGP